MAEVVVEQAAQNAPSNSINGDVNGIFHFIAQYWYIWLFIILIIVIAIIIIYYVWKWGMNNKRKDPMYVQYENTLDAAKLNKKRDWIIKKRRWKLLWLSLITVPVFVLVYLVLLAGEHWLLVILLFIGGIIIWIPFAWIFYKDYSIRIINVDKITQGFYRGHAKRMDGFYYILICIGKKWLVLDNNILLRIPQDVRTIKTVTRKNKEGEKRTENIWDTITMAGGIIVENENGWYIFIPYTSLVKEATYYYEPTLVDDKGKILDLRQKIANSYHLITQIAMAEQEYSHLGKVTNNAVDSNVGVTAQKKMPEKQRDVGNGENNVA